MAAFNLFNLSLLLSLFSNLGIWPETRTNHGLGFSPPSCNRIECPSYDLIHSGSGNGHAYEIRRYNSSVWISTSPIPDISLVGATRTGFLQYVTYPLLFFFLLVQILLFFICSSKNLD